MSAAIAEATMQEQLKRAIRRLESAAYSLEDAASDAQAAVEDIGDLSSATKAPSGSNLVREVVKFHDENHSGPMRWCIEICRCADEVSA